MQTRSNFKSASYVVFVKNKKDFCSVILVNKKKKKIIASI